MPSRFLGSHEIQFNWGIWKSDWSTFVISCTRQERDFLCCIWAFWNDSIWNFWILCVKYNTLKGISWPGSKRRFHRVKSGKQSMYFISFLHGAFPTNKVIPSSPCFGFSSIPTYLGSLASPHKVQFPHAFWYVFLLCSGTNFPVLVEGETR